MSPISYPNFVNTSDIHEIGNSTHRYILYIPFNKKNTDHDTLVVVLKNPSKATPYQADVTVSKVCNVAYYNGYASVIILNLFPIRSTNPSGVLQLYNNPDFDSIMEENFVHIKNECKNRDVILAWGKDSISKSSLNSKRNKEIYKKVVRRVTRIVSKYAAKTFFVRSCSCPHQSNKCVISCAKPHSERYPLHGQRWCNQEKLITYN